jgi:hypothetical protein
MDSVISQVEANHAARCADAVAITSVAEPPPGRQDRRVEDAGDEEHAGQDAHGAIRTHSGHLQRFGRAGDHAGRAEDVLAGAVSATTPEHSAAASARDRGGQAWTGCAGAGD